jgi:hypothetical protein
MKKRTYIICPVRFVSPEESEALKNYVDSLGEDYEVHYPPRDVDQTQDGTAICEQHRDFMLTADEIHVFWNGVSTGSHFDLGMAYALAATKKIKFVMINKLERTPTKSFGNFLLDLVERSK